MLENPPPGFVVKEVYKGISICRNTSNMMLPFHTRNGVVAVEPTHYVVVTETEFGYHFGYSGLGEPSPTFYTSPIKTQLKTMIKSYIANKKHNEREVYKQRIKENKARIKDAIKRIKAGEEFHFEDECRGWD